MWKADNSLRLLTSYHYWRNFDMAEFARLPVPVRLFADSGAFSAKSTGAEVRIEEYAEWLRAHRGLFAAAANLDVIGDAAATWRNQLRLEALAGMPITPVFHCGSDWSWFDRYCSGYPYVALGGMVGVPFNRAMPWMVACFRRARAKGSATVFHGFGQTKPEAMAALPWFSCDSSTWTACHRFGTISLWDRSVRRMRTLHVGDKRNLVGLGHLIRGYGLDPAPYLRRDCPRAAMATLSGLSWIAMGNDMARRHGEVPRQDGADVPGFHLYLANDVMRDFRPLAEHLALTNAEALAQ